MSFTLVGPCEYREEIRKSRFITLAAPISSAAEAQAFIEQNSDLNATHNCWAWKLADQYRSNDDGEPGGTAGRPILAAIEAQEFDQVVVLGSAGMAAFSSALAAWPGLTAVAPINACNRPSACH